MQVSTLLTILSIVLSILIIALVLIQRPQTDSAGAFSVDGGGSHTRRGAEKTIWRLTAFLGFAFGVVHTVLFVMHS